MAEATGDSGDRAHGPNPPSESHFNNPESPANASVDIPNPPSPRNESSANVSVEIPNPASPRNVNASQTFRHPITGENLSPQRFTTLKAWALQKGKVMGMGDTDDLGDVTDYVYAGALAWEDTVQMRNLIKKSRIRPLQLRRAITVNRQQNAQACIAYLCGTVARKPCVPCSRGSGPFAECVTVEGSLLGACASCHYGGEGNRCTFHISSKSFHLRPIRSMCGC